MSAGPPDDEALAPGESADEQERSLAQVQAGGIPVGAERRLQELRSRPGAFTSDLSVGSFALCHRLGLRPLAQVMGSSVYQVGYQQGMWPVLGGQVIAELDTLSHAWNEVRGRALGRLALEAAQAGADAVVGVSVRSGAYDWAAGSIEYVAVGTAVRNERARQDGPPVLTELSVADYAKLLEAGVRPAGIVAWTSVFFASYYRGGMFGEGGGMLGTAQNFELRELTQAVYAWREQTMGRLGEQAQRLGAQGIVGVRIGHRVSHMEAGAGIGGRPPGMMITFDAIGTAIHDSAAAAPPAPLTTVDLSA